MRASASGMSIQGERHPLLSSMAPEDQLWMSPFQKWRLYRKFPWKLVIHISLAVLTVTQLLVLSGQTAFFAGNYATLRAVFLSPSESDSSSIRYYYTVQDLLTAYYDVETVPTANYTLPRDADGNIVPPTMVVTAYSAGLGSPAVTNTYQVTEERPCGPFCGSPDALSQMVQDVISISIQFSVRTQEISEGVIMSVVWTCSVNYVIAGNGGRTEATLDVSAFAVDSLPDSFRRPARFWLSIVIILLATVSLVLTLRALRRALRVFLRTRKAALDGQWMAAGAVPLAVLARDSTTALPALHAPPVPPRSDNPREMWARLPWRSKLRFFNLWHFMILVSNALNIGASIAFLTGSASTMTEPGARFLVGSSVLAACVSLLRYFEFNLKYYMLMHTLRVALPNIARFLLTIFPLFFGYALFGMAFFGQCSARFATLDVSAVNLFALLNGDEIADTFNDVFVCQPVLSRIYLYSFISLFIYAVLNIFISLIEDAFVTSTLSLQRTAQDQHELQHAMGLAHDHDVEAPVVGAAMAYAHAQQYGTALPAAAVGAGTAAAAAGSTSRSAVALAAPRAAGTDADTDSASDSPGGPAAGSVAAAAVPLPTRWRHNESRPLLADLGTGISSAASVGAASMHAAADSALAREQRLRAMLARHMREINELLGSDEFGPAFPAGVSAPVQMPLPREHGDSPRSTAHASGSLSGRRQRAE